MQKSYQSRSYGWQNRIYISKNAFTRKHSTYQILVIIIIIYQIFMYESSIRSQFFHYHFESITLILLNYILLVFLFYDYILISLSDPADKILTGEEQEKMFNPQDLIYCIMCCHLVKSTSYHCWRCQRCSQSFDHHCPFLNCCIAKSNYHPFLSLLALYIIFCTNQLYQGLVVPARATTLIFIVVSVVSLSLVLSLLVFHCILNLKLNMTTVQLIARVKKSNRHQCNNSQKTSQINQNQNISFPTDSIPQ